MIMRKHFLRVAFQLSRLNLFNSSKTYRTYVEHPVSSLALKLKCSSPLSKLRHYSTEADQNSAVDDETIQGPSAELNKSLSEDDQKRLQIIWMEVEVFRQSGYEVPKRLTDEQWRELLEMTGYMQRRRFCRFLLVREVRKEADKRKKEERRKLREEEDEMRKNDEPQVIDPLEYGLRRNTIFHRIQDTTMNVVYNHWACQAILYGQSLVFDLDYDSHMRKMDCNNCAEQLQIAYGANKLNRDQFYLHICNAQSDSITLKSLERFIPNLYEPTCLMNVTSKSYLDLFPKEKIVYLTPHCDETLVEYDHDAVYIIGGLVDKSVQKPVSLAKAKKEGLKMAKLPLDKFLLWGVAGKSLTLDQMMKIMLDIKNTGDWNFALRNVPQRKLKKVEMNDQFDARFKNRKQRCLFFDEKSNQRSNTRYNYVKK